VRIFGVILAGGTGRRMGGADKAFLRLGDRFLIDRVVERLEPQVEQLAISANGDPARFAAQRCTVLPDELPLGPLSGILAALDWAAAAGATHVVSVAVDTPFFPADLVPQLLLAAETSSTPIALAESEGQVHPTFGLWPIALRGDLKDTVARGEARVMDFASRHRHGLAEFSGEATFLNVNSPADLTRAEAMLRGSP
jgi:molybdopterin-guanine dinucleotide biosynthesis protein A